MANSQIPLRFESGKVYANSVCIGWILRDREDRKTYLNLTGVVTVAKRNQAAARRWLRRNIDWLFPIVRENLLKGVSHV